jgi:cysteine synthase A
MVLSAQRRAVYTHLQSVVGATPLRVLPHASREINGMVLVKEEFRNPTGSHYDRLILDLLHSRENSGIYTPGYTHLLDATSGNSGASLAWLSRALGFKCTIVIPKDMPTARMAQISGYGARVITSPAGEYVAGAITEMMRELKEGIRRRDRYALVNHAADLEVIPRSADALGKEILSDLRTTSVKRLDYLVLALGNGSTLGVIPALREFAPLTVVGFEPAESPINFIARYGVDALPDCEQKARVDNPNHGLLGTGPGQTSFGWPLLAAGLAQVDEIMTIARAEWESEFISIADREGLHCGRTTAAAYSLARQIGMSQRGANILFLGYDPSWKYLTMNEL